MTRTLDQAMGGGASAAPSSSTTLATTDFDRPLFPTGTITLTAPNGGAGWRTGTIRNANTASGLVTLAVPSGATLDGVTNGTTILRPYQRARIVQTGATAYATDWIDRSPIVASATISAATASVDLAMPAGYAAFDLDASQLTIDTDGASVGLRFSDGTSFKTGASDYFVDLVSAPSNTSAPATGAGSLSYLEVAALVRVSGYTDLLNANDRIYPGGASASPTANIISSHINTTPATILRTTHGRYATAAMLATAIRVLASSGNLTGGTLILRGIAP